MAEDTEGTERRPAPTGAGGSNAFTRKLGPLPMWAWMGIGLAVALAYSSWRKNKAASTAGTTAAATGTQTASQTPPIIVQNFPSQGTQGPQGPAGPPGQPGTPGTPGAPGTPAPPPVTPPSGGQPKPPKGGGGGQPKYQAYVVQPGDSLSSIASKFHVPGGWQTLWSFNTGPNSPHSKQAVATMKQRGPNLIYHGETIYIPA